MDANRAATISAYSGLASVVLAIATVVLMVSPSLPDRLSKEPVMGQVVGWGPIILLASCLLLAGWFHLRAAQLARSAGRPPDRASDSAEPATGPAGVALSDSAVESLTAQLAAEREQVQSLRVQLAAESEQRERERIDKESLHAHAVDWSQTHKRLKDEYDEHLWKVRYGEERPAFPDDYHWRASVCDAIAGVTPSLDAACEGALALLRSFLRQMGNDEERGRCPRYLAHFVEDRVAVRLHAARGFLHRDLDCKDLVDDDPRLSLVGFYYRYHEARDWLSRLATLLDADLRQVPEYPGWRAADEEFHKDLGKALALNSLKAVRQEIDAISRARGYPSPLPSP